MQGRSKTKKFRGALLKYSGIEVLEGTCVVCEAHLLLGGSGGMHPQENFEKQVL